MREDTSVFAFQIGDDYCMISEPSGESGFSTVHVLRGGDKDMMTDNEIKNLLYGILGSFSRELSLEEAKDKMRDVLTDFLDELERFGVIRPSQVAK